MSKPQATIKYFLAAAALGSDVPRMTISTNASDREGDRVIPEGGDFKNFLKNPVLCWVHDYKHIPIGRVTSIEVQPGKGVDATWAWLENDDFAARVKNAYDQGCINASSIGFIPKESAPNGKGHDITAWEMLELTLCPIPMNPEAVRAMKSLGFDAKAAELSDNERRNRLEAAVIARFGPNDPSSNCWIYLIDTYESYLVFRDKDGKYRRIGYTIADDGAVNLTGAAVEVVVEYVALDGEKGFAGPTVKATAAVFSALKNLQPGERHSTADVRDATDAVNILHGLASSEVSGGHGTHADHLRQAAAHVIQYLQGEFNEQFGIAADGTPDISDAEIDGSVMQDAATDAPLIPMDDDTKYPFVSATGLSGEAKSALVKGINEAFVARVKRGRRISAANEAKLKNAHAHMKAAHETVGDVLACVKNETLTTDGTGSDQDDLGGDDTGMIALSITDDDIVLDLFDPPRLTLDIKDVPDMLDVDPAALRAALGDIVRESLRGELTTAMQTAVDRARGRVVV